MKEVQHNINPYNVKVLSDKNYTINSHVIKEGLRSPLWVGICNNIVAWISDNSSSFYTLSNVWIDRPLMLPVSSLPEKEFFIFLKLFLFLILFSDGREVEVVVHIVQEIQT